MFEKEVVLEVCWYVFYLVKGVVVVCNQIFDDLVCIVCGVSKVQVNYDEDCVFKRQCGWRVWGGVNNLLLVVDYVL